MSVKARYSNYLNFSIFLKSEKFLKFPLSLLIGLKWLKERQN